MPATCWEELRDDLRQQRSNDLRPNSSSAAPSRRRRGLAGGILADRVLGPEASKADRDALKQKLSATGSFLINSESRLEMARNED